MNCRYLDAQTHRISQTPTILSLSKDRSSFQRCGARARSKGRPCDKLRASGSGVCFLLLSASPAHAEPYADLAAIDRAVAEFVGVPAPPVDRRLRLNPCSVPLALSWHGARSDRVQVTCPGTGGWTLYVALPASASAAAPPPLVQRGDAVTIRAGGDGFAVSQPGEALDSGAAGAWIKVRPAGTGSNAAPLRAQVLRPGVVGISLP